MDVQPLRFFTSPGAFASPDIYRIWIDCCLPEISKMNDILWALDTWARLNCRIEMRINNHSNNEIPYLFWLSPSGVRHECFADTFSHWFLCGCVEVKAPSVALNLPVDILTSSSEKEEELLGQLTDEQSTAVDQQLEKIMIDNLSEENVKIDDISHFDLELFLSTSTQLDTPRYDSAHMPFHNHTK